MLQFRSLYKVKLIFFATTFFILNYSFAQVNRYNYVLKKHRLLNVHGDNGRYTKDSTFTKFTARVISDSTFMMQQKLVEVEHPLSKAQPESSLGNWVADACRAYCSEQLCKTDACILSYSLIGKEYVAPGQLLWRDLYEIIPYENKIVLYQINGEQIQYLCDSIASFGGVPTSGLRFIINHQKAEEISIGQQKLNPHLIYTVAVDDRLPKNKKFAVIFKDVYASHQVIKVRDILAIEAVKTNRNQSKIKTILDQRIRYNE